MTPQEMETVASLVAKKMEPTRASLSEDEQRWVKLAIQREAQSFAFRRAVIEKTISSLIWTILGMLALGIGSYINQHWIK